MFSTCIFCHANLGANKVVEHFPVGRRLAFDAARGRLWVVCRACERWNLTPIEERWEAVEECERLFRATPLRVSTEHIGLARVKEGLELVRVGEPQRPEMAAWRYGDQFGTRRRRAILVGAATAVGVGAIAIGGVATGMLAGGAANLVANGFHLLRNSRRRSVLANRVQTPAGPVALTHAQAAKSAIVKSSAHGWALRIHYLTADPRTSTAWWVPQVTGRSLDGETSRFRASFLADLPPESALPALGVLLPVINASGASRAKVRGAVEMIEQWPRPELLLQRAAGAAVALRQRSQAGTSPISGLPAEIRLALEMVAHEEDERRALEGELRALEARWRDAEEIASIADNLFLPRAVADWIGRARGGNS